MHLNSIHTSNVFVMLIALAILAGCGATHLRKPLGEGRSQIHASVGGPLITVGAPIPAPYSTVGYAYGVHEKLNLHAAIHPTAIAYKNYAMEFGAGYGVLKQEGWIPEVYGDLRAALATDGGNWAFMPILTPVVSWQWRFLNPYLGTDFLFQFNDSDQAALPQSISPFVGMNFLIGDAWGTGLELKWASVNHSFKNSSIDHPSALGSDKGVLAPHLFVSYQFGGEK